MNEQQADKIIKLLEKINQRMFGIGLAIALIFAALLWQLLHEFWVWAH